MLDFFLLNVGNFFVGCWNFFLSKKKQKKQKNCFTFEKSKKIASHSTNEAEKA
jgi:hypothetical protein